MIITIMESTNIDGLVKSRQLHKIAFFRGRFPLRQVEKVDCRANQEVAFLTLLKISGTPDFLRDQQYCKDKKMVVKKMSRDYALFQNT